jgi:hypothetical protein
MVQRLVRRLSKFDRHDVVAGQAMLLLTKHHLASPLRVEDETSSDSIWIEVREGMTLGEIGRLIDAANEKKRNAVKTGERCVSKTLNDLIRGQHLPKSLIEDMEKTEPGMLSAALGEMVYARSHDGQMKSCYPEKVYLKTTPRSEYMATQIGVEDNYVKSDVVVAKVIALLDALALQHALERR